eukprot:6314031-Amphidinium_carterae.1
MKPVIQTNEYLWGGASALILNSGFWTPVDARCQALVGYQTRRSTNESICAVVRQGCNIRVHLWPFMRPR